MLILKMSSSGLRNFCDRH